MKKYKLIYALILSIPLSIFAQKNAQGCDGKRYLKDVFTDTTRTVVQYGSNQLIKGGTYNLSMDIVQPKGDTMSKRPAIVFAFGGGFVYGERSSMSPFCEYFSKKGYVCITIDYRLWDLYGIGRVPDSIGIAQIGTQAMQDMKAAIRFLRKDAATTNKYRIDPDNIIAGGVSAGAITAMLVGHLDSTDVIADFYRATVISEGGFEGNSGTPGYSSTVKGILNMSGGLYRKEIIDKNDPPFASYHGTIDDVVPYGLGKNVYGFLNDGSSTCFAQAKAWGTPFVLYTVKGGGHSNIYPTPTTAFQKEFDAFQDAAVVFTKQVVCGDPITTATLSPTTEIDASKISVYPNPSFDIVTVDFTKNTEGGQHDVSVLDITGRVVFYQKNIQNNLVLLNKNQIGEGIFFVKIESKNADLPLVKKIVFN
jgi:Secretion system C-terminal sorting domain/Carboxylesterase family